jgi:hypothetical protein
MIRHSVARLGGAERVSIARRRDDGRDQQREQKAAIGGGPEHQAASDLRRFVGRGGDHARPRSAANWLAMM